MSEPVLSHEPDANRYTLHVGDQLVSVLDYREAGDTTSFTRTFTLPQHRGAGHADTLTTFAVADAAERGLKVVPMCWYVAEWFDRHPEQAHLRVGTGA